LNSAGNRFKFVKIHLRRIGRFVLNFIEDWSSFNQAIQVFDASGTANTYNITISRNSNLINGNAGNFIIDVAGGWYTLVYTGATYGWKVG
jgi:hypothetical protein